MDDAVNRIALALPLTVTLLLGACGGGGGAGIPLPTHTVETSGAFVNLASAVNDEDAPVTGTDDGRFVITPGEDVTFTATLGNGEEISITLSCVEHSGGADCDVAVTTAPTGDQTLTTTGNEISVTTGAPEITEVDRRGSADLSPGEFDIGAGGYRSFGATTFFCPRTGRTCRVTVTGTGDLQSITSLGGAATVSVTDFPSTIRLSPTKGSYTREAAATQYSDFPVYTSALARNHNTNTVGIASETDRPYIHSIGTNFLGRKNPVRTIFSIDGLNQTPVIERTYDEYKNGVVWAPEEQFAEGGAAAILNDLELWIKPLGYVDDESPVLANGYFAVGHWGLWRSSDNTGWDGVYAIGRGTWPADLAAISGTASYRGAMHGWLWESDGTTPDVSDDRRDIRGDFILTADFNANRITGSVNGISVQDTESDGGEWQDWDRSVTMNLIDATLTGSQLSATWSGSTEGAPGATNLNGFTGALAGEFFGPDGGGIAGVINGQRPASGDLPTQFILAPFGAARER